MKHRNDKKFPNDVITYQKTMLNIKEDIQFEEILSLHDATGSFATSSKINKKNFNF